MTDGNGSWSGRDPLLRMLRAVAVAVFLALLCFGVITRSMDGTVVGTLMGGLIVLLGYQVSRWVK